MGRVCLSWAPAPLEFPHNAKGLCSLGSSWSPQSLAQGFCNLCFALHPFPWQQSEEGQPRSPRVGGRAGAKPFPCCATSPVCGLRLLMGTLGGDGCIHLPFSCSKMSCPCLCLPGILLFWGVPPGSFLWQQLLAGSNSLRAGAVGVAAEIKGRELGRGPWCCHVPPGWGDQTPQSCLSSLLVLITGWAGRIAARVGEMAGEPQCPL